VILGDTPTEAQNDELVADLQGQLTAISNQMALVSSLVQDVMSSLQSLSDQIAELNTRSQQDTVRERVLPMLPAVAPRARADNARRGGWGLPMRGRRPPRTPSARR